MDISRCLQSKELFIFDMDGTIYLGSEVFPFAVHFIKRLRENGKRVLFFTNNTTKSASSYFEKLSRMGFEPSRDEILSAGNATIEFLKKHRPGKSVYLVGTPDLCRQFEEAGITLCDDPDIVISSFDTTLVYDKLDRACRFIRHGAEYLCTHPDLNCPMEGGEFLPDSGAIAALISASTGVKPTYIGKPYAPTIELISGYTGVGLDKMCVFGDRLYTDIALGRRNGVTAVLVLTGETKREEAESADESSRPDYIEESLGTVEEKMFG